MNYFSFRSWMKYNYCFMPFNCLSCKNLYFWNFIEIIQIVSDFIIRLLIALLIKIESNLFNIRDFFKDFGRKCCIYVISSDICLLRLRGEVRCSKKHWSIVWLFRKYNSGSGAVWRHFFNTTQIWKWADSRETTNYDISLRW